MKYSGNMTYNAALSYYATATSQVYEFGVGWRDPYQESREQALMAEILSGDMDLQVLEEAITEHRRALEMAVTALRTLSPQSPLLPTLVAILEQAA